ncbi:MAG: hypothetical protein LC794_04735 [Acidobacteria bacterium]|nr:hypothetical protein [Acidobacteriota bacterium]
MFNFNIFDRVVEGGDFSQQCPQARTPPRAIGQVIERVVVRFLLRDMKRLVERAVRCLDAQVVSENYERLS